MKKRKWLIPLGIIIGIAVLSVAALWILTARGFGLSVGRCLIAENGTYMLIEGNSPIVMSNRIGNEGIFEELETGDKILVLHDGVNESYPGGTGVYGIFRLGGGDISDIPEQVLEQLTDLGWLGGGDNQGNEEAAYPNSDAVTVEENIVEYSYGYANMSISIPEGWEYEVEEYSQTSQSFGISFWPAGQTTGKLKLQYMNMFGVCGTDLSQEKITVGEYEANKGTYGNAKVWSFISLKNTPGSYVILVDGASAWLETYMDEAMSIIDTIRVGEGIMNREEAIAAAEQKLSGSDITYDTTRGSFDYATGTWTVTFSDKKGNETSVCIP